MDIDNDCSKHMTERIQMLSSIQNKDKGTVTFGDNSKGYVVGIGIVSDSTKPLIENVLLVNGLEHNLLIINQLCDKVYKIIFQKDASYL